MLIAFTVYGKASPAGSKVGYAVGGKVRIVDAAKGSRSWKQEVTREAMRVMAGRPPLDGPLELLLVFHVKRPSGHFGKRGLRASAPAYPAVKPDLTKLTRAVEDACNGVVWRDDARIVRQLLAKVYADAEGECVEVQVTGVTGGKHGS